jgi:WD40-like Beta Propeller Repeat
VAAGLVPGRTVDRLSARGRSGTVRRHLHDPGQRQGQDVPIRELYRPMQSRQHPLLVAGRDADQPPASSPRVRVRGFVALPPSSRTDGSDLHQITQVGTTPDQPGYEDYSPIWSPDGTQFAFQRFDPNKHKHAIFIVGTDGSGLRRITPWNRDAAEPDWSPNGRWIAFRTLKGTQTLD